MKDASFTAQAVRPLPHQAMPPHILDLLEWQGRQALRPVRHAFFDKVKDATLPVIWAAGVA